MVVKTTDDWMDGFIAGAALATENYSLYDERVAEYLAAKEMKTSPKAAEKPETN